MIHVVSLSGGMSSAVAAERVFERYGQDDVVLWFADTAWEDEDLYRFLDDLDYHWLGAKRILRYKDGRTPLEVAEDARIIPNSRIAPCTFKLKIEPFVKYLESLPKPVTVHIGMDWREMHRLKGPQERYGAIDGVTCEFPLLWEPIEYRPYAEIVRSWGIRIPRLYELGFSHNNCGGRCIKQGFEDFRHLLQAMPERYAEVEAFEERMRAKGGTFEGKAILRSRANKEITPIPLSLLRTIPFGTTVVPENPDDNGACVCTY